MAIDRGWNLAMTRAREALALLPRIPNTDDVIDWGGVDVAHLDTGCTRHVVLGPWMADDSPIVHAGRGLNLIEVGELPFDPLTYVGNPGHGTRTLSVLCAGLPGLFVGTAPALPTVPYRVTNGSVISSLTTQKRLAAAIRHAVDSAACEVISISLGTPVLSPFSNPLGEAVDHAYDHGVVVVAAGGQVIDRVTYPGKFFRSIGVGGVNQDRTVYMRYAGADGAGGDAEGFIDVWAPADPIWRANAMLVDGRPGEAPYDYGDGTSYAAAQVAAAAAMWLAHHGHEALGSRYPKRWQRIEALRKLLRTTAQKLAGRERPARGTGILDIAALLQAKLPPASGLWEEKRSAGGQWG